MTRRSLVRVLGALNHEVRTRGILTTASSLGPFERDALLERPEHVHTTLHQALHSVCSRMYWETTSWTRNSRPADHDAASTRKHARYNSLRAPGAASFLCAHPSLTSRVSSSVWSCMLRRHLDTPVYDDSIHPLVCAHCHRSMDARGDHASICRHGFGVIHRLETVRNVLARYAFRAAGLQCDLEVPYMLPDTARCPADLLVQPTAPPAGAPPDRPTAYDITVRSPYRSGALSTAALNIAGAAEAGDTEKFSAHARAVRAVYHLQSDAPLPPLEWYFCPLAFDTLGAPSERTNSVLETLAHQIARRTSTSYGTAKLRLQQRLSFAIWSSVASATLSRMPCHDVALSHPAQV